MRACAHRLPDVTKTHFESTNLGTDAERSQRARDYDARALAEQSEDGDAANADQIVGEVTSTAARAHIFVLSPPPLETGTGNIILKLV